MQSEPRPRATFLPDAQASNMVSRLRSLHSLPLLDANLRFGVWCLVTKTTPYPTHARQEWAAATI